MSCDIHVRSVARVEWKAVRRGGGGGGSSSTLVYDDTRAVLERGCDVKPCRCGDDGGDVMVVM